MPLDPVSVVCKCPKCLLVNQEGCWFTKKGLRVHKASNAASVHLQREIADETPEETTQTIESEVFVAALTDDGPDSSSYSRLWSSRMEVQEASSSDLRPQESLSFPAAEIQSGLENILYSNATSTKHIPSLTPTQAPSMPSPPVPAIPLNSRPMLASGQGPLTGPGRRRTHKAHQTLEKVIKAISTYRARLLSASSANCLRDLQFDIETSRAVLRQIKNRQADLLNKVSELRSELVRLSDAIAEKRESMLDANDVPVEFNSGKEIDYPYCVEPSLTLPRSSL